MQQELLMNTYSNDYRHKSIIFSLKSLMVTILSSPSLAQLRQTAVFTLLKREASKTGVEQMRQGRWSLIAGAFSIS